MSGSCVSEEEDLFLPLENVFYKIVQKKFSTISTPVQFGSVLSELRRHTVEVESALDHLFDYDQLIYEFDQKGCTFTLKMGKATILYDPNKDGIVRLQQPILNTPHIVIKNMYYATAEDLNYFHGRKYELAQSIKIAPWFLNVLKHRKKNIHIDAYYASDGQIQQIVDCLSTRVSLRIRNLSWPLLTLLNLKKKNINAVTLDLRLKLLVIPDIQEIQIDSLNQFYNDDEIIRNISPLTHVFTFEMGNHPISFDEFPSFQKYFAMNLDKLALYFGFINTDSQADVETVRNELIDLVSRLLHCISHLRHEAKIKETVELHFAYYWNNQDVMLNKKMLKRHPVVQSACNKLRQSVGKATFLVNIDFGHNQEPLKHLLRIDVHPPKLPETGTLVFPSM